MRWGEVYFKWMQVIFPAGTNSAQYSVCVMGGGGGGDVPTSMQVNNIACWFDEQYHSQYCLLGGMLRGGGGGGALSADWTEVNDTAAVGICTGIDHHNL